MVFKLLVDVCVVYLRVVTDARDVIVVASTSFASSPPSFFGGRCSTVFCKIVCSEVFCAQFEVLKLHTMVSIAESRYKLV